MISVAQMGLEPTASLLLSQGGLPIAYRAVDELHQYPEQGSNLQSLGVRPSRSTDGVPGRVVSIKVVPDGIEPSFPGCEPSVVAVGPRDYVQAEAVRLELTSGLSRHLFSRQAPHPAG